MISATATNRLLPPRTRACEKQVVAVLTLFSALNAGCERDKREIVRVSGASTVYPIIQMAAEDLRERSSFKVQAQAGGSTRGFMDVIAGRTDLGTMARDLTPEESSQVRAFPIALDGVGVVVHKSNPVSGLSSADLRRIYQKHATDWGDFGGKPGEIVVVTKAEGHATLQAFLDHTRLSRDSVKADVVAGNNAQVIQSVATSMRSIGYVSIGEADHAASSGMHVRLLPLNGIPPRQACVADGTWPMRRTLYLISKDEPRGGCRSLLDYLKSPEGSQIIERGGYVPIR